MMPFGPAIDGSKVGLPDLPLTLIQKGQFNRVPCIFGTNKDEGVSFSPLFQYLIPTASTPPSQSDIIEGKAPPRLVPSPPRLYLRLLALLLWLRGMQRS
jgi:carboxylesterase type B